MPSVRNSLRARLQRGETIVAPGAYDPLSARVVQVLGFTAVYTGGYMTGAHTSITEPLLTLTEQVEVAQKVARAVDLPVLTTLARGTVIRCTSCAACGSLRWRGSPASTSKTRSIPSVPPITRGWSTSSPCRNSSSDDLRPASAP